MTSDETRPDRGSEGSAKLAGNSPDQPTPAEDIEPCPNYPATCRGCVECRATDFDHDGPCFCDCPMADQPTRGAAQRVAELVQWGERGGLEGVSLDAIRAALYAVSEPAGRGALQPCGDVVAGGHNTYAAACSACVECNSDAPEWTI